MKVLYFTHYPDLYGANKSLLEMVIRLKNTYEVEPIIVILSYGALNKELDKLNIENYSLKYYQWVTDKEDSFIKAFIKKCRKDIFNSKAIDEILKMVDIEKVDIVHSNSSAIDIGSYVAKKINKAHIWHLREFGEEDYSFRYYCSLKKAYTFIENNSDKVIFISKALFNKYESYVKNNKKVSIIYNGVEEEKYYLEINKYLDNDKLKIVFSGLLSERKNQLELIRAVDYLVNEKNKKNLSVYFIGDGDKEYKDNLINYINSNNLHDNISLLGYIENVKDTLKDGDIGIITSNKEAFGRVTVEYMMSGLAVIGSDAGANREIIEHGVDGLLYKLGNYKELADRIESLYDNRNQLLKMKVKAQEKALRYFTSSINAKNIFNIYKEVIK